MAAAQANSSGFTDASSLFCITDVGSTTTKAILFEQKDGTWRFFRKEAPTTVEKPHEDVSVGVMNAIRALEQETGHTLLEDGAPCVPYLSTSSAGGGLAMVVTGLVRDLTAQSADRVALGAGAIVLDVIAMNDGRTPYRKIEDLKLLRPDMVLLAGGFDGDNISGPVYLSELIIESGLHPKLSKEAKLDIIYGGNTNARDYVAKVLESGYQFHSVPNIRPAGDREDAEPARKKIHELFMDHVMSQAPGYQRIKPWVSAPIRPTPAAFGNILAHISRDLNKAIMAIDLGGATTDIFSAVGGNVFRTVSANLGMSYSIRNVAELGGIASIQALHPSGLSEADLWNLIGNKQINPTRLPTTVEEMVTEWAVATIAIREAVVEHLHVMQTSAEEVPPLRPDIDDLIRGPRRNWRKELEPSGRLELTLEDYDMVIGSGGILSHSPREAAAMMLIDALQPVGVVELAVDSAFMFPHLGVLAEVNAELAKRLFYDLGIVRLGTVCAPAGHEEAQAFRVSGKTSKGRTIDECAESEEVRVIPLAEDEELTLRWTADEEEHELAVHGGVCGLMVDNRTRHIRKGAESLLVGEYVPPAQAAEVEPEASIQKGPIRLRRELAIPGNVFVSAGEEVKTDTLVARSTRQFLRPFFIDVARTLDIPPEDTEKCLLKGVGDEIGLGDVIARRARKMLSFKVVRSNVRARIEKILPNGTLVARELPELAREYATVKVAQDLGKPAWQIRPYLRVEPGQPVERGQWLAAEVGPAGVRHSESPVRGKVNRIDFDFGMIVIEPLLEELEVRAWIPGKVEEVSEKGCIVASEGTVLNGAWGLGREASGILTFNEPEPEKVVVRHFADTALLKQMKESGAAGLVTGGIDLKDMLGAEPTFTVVVIEGFGAQEITPEVYRLLQDHEGRLTLIDGTTQMRVGVRRPKVILPEGR
jgi:uncharacterized protein (TIGR01319 family)